MQHAVTGLKAGAWMLSSIYNTPWVSLSGFMTITANGITQYLPAVESSSWTSSIYLQQPRRYNFLASREWPTLSFSQCFLIFFFLSLSCCPAKPQSKLVSISLSSSIVFHSELGEAAESTSSFSKSLGEDDCPPLTRFHFILLFWNHTLTWVKTGHVIRTCNWC